MTQPPKTDPNNQADEEYLSPEMTPPKSALDEALPEAPADRAGQIEVLLGRTLRIGVAASVLLLIGGLAMEAVQRDGHLIERGKAGELVGIGTKPPNGKPKTVEFPHTLSRVARCMADLRGCGFIAAGLLMLIATPIARVAISVVALASVRDWIYVALALLVLALLGLSFVIGKR